jgi:transcriptional regulator with XRE-family HTH domain
VSFLGDRLREERERLGYNQTQLAVIGDTTKKSQIDYEKGNSYPKGNYLEAVSKLGIDVQYIITGQRSTLSLTEEENELINLWRKANIHAKHASWGALTAEAQAAAGSHKYQQTNHGSGNAQGDGAIGQVINNHGGQSTISVDTNLGQVAGKIHNH